MGKSESCDATLRIDGRTYQGRTGQGHGHAEMDALHQFISWLKRDDEPRDKGYYLKRAVQIIKDDDDKKVWCPTRPVCLQCGKILQGLGFEAAEDTVWGDKTMGSTEWGLTKEVKHFLIEFELDFDKVINLRRGSDSREFTAAMRRK